MRLKPRRVWVGSGRGNVQQDWDWGRNKGIQSGLRLEDTGKISKVSQERREVACCWLRLRGFVDGPVSQVIWGSPAWGEPRSLGQFLGHVII